MCHPFHRIIDSSVSCGPVEQVFDHASNAESLHEPRLLSTSTVNVQSRRRWLVRLITGAAAVVTALKTSRVQAGQLTISPATPQQSSGQSTIPSQPPVSSDLVTSQALGEEGGSYPPPRSGPITSQALGEEGSSWPSYPAQTYPPALYPPPRPLPPGTSTTQALGEEGGSYLPRPPVYDGRVTTYALGEEGSYYGRPRSRIIRPPYRGVPSGPPPGTVTTFALGEEGAGYPPPR